MAAVPLGLPSHPVAPLGCLGHLLSLNVRRHLRQRQVAASRDGRCSKAISMTATGREKSMVRAARCKIMSKFWKSASM